MVPAVWWVIRAVLVLLAMHAAPAAAEPLPRLPALGLRADGVTVSGLSSGAYMAGQFEVAYSATVGGAAIVAGGPYGCSRGNLATAATLCSCPAEAHGIGCSVLGEAMYLGFAEAAMRANRGDIDDPAHLAGHRVWLFTGGKDAVVASPIVESAASFYRTRGVTAGRLHVERDKDAGHGFPSPLASLPCGITAQPFIVDCGGLDGAGALLRWLYPDLPASAGTGSGAVNRSAWRAFSQTRYLGTGFTGLDDTGWIYVPPRCERAGARCRLHVVFHGCEQGQSFVVAPGRTFGRQFIEATGYARWAEAGGIVVLYPQVRASAGSTPLSSYRVNPKGCWDFWGYSTDTIDTDPTRFAQRGAPQMKAVKAMVDDLLRASPTAPAPR